MENRNANQDQDGEGAGQLENSLTELLSHAALVRRRSRTWRRPPLPAHFVIKAAATPTQQLIQTKAPPNSHLRIARDDDLPQAARSTESRGFTRILAD
jgi:hypothetical protein